jgi:5-methylcytosine-specific restriction endonuclease McrA
MRLRKSTVDEVLTRAGGLCESCKSPGDWRGLQIDHSVPKKMGGTRHEYSAEELQVLCGRCHDLKHGIIDR